MGRGKGCVVNTTIGGGIVSEKLKEEVFWVFFVFLQKKKKKVFLSVCRVAPHLRTAIPSS